MAQAKLLLVAGISCSGKTTLAKQVALELGAHHLSMDDYYRPYAELPIEARKQVNFDSPAAIEHELLVSHLERLIDGQAIHKPIYDAPSFSRLEYHDHVASTEFIVLEGLFCLYWPDLVGLSRHRIFVETDPSLCLARRVDRDTRLYGRSEEESLRRYRTQVEPNQNRFVLPTKGNSTLIVSGASGLSVATQAVLEDLLVSA